MESSKTVFMNLGLQSTTSWHTYHEAGEVIQRSDESLRDEMMLDLRSARSQCLVD